MTTQDSITVDSFASMDGDCPIETRVACGETQLFLGTRTRSLTLVLTEQALANLATETTQALTQLRPTTAG